MEDQSQALKKIGVLLIAGLVLGGCAKKTGTGTVAGSGVSGAPSGVAVSAGATLPQIQGAKETAAAVGGKVSLGVSGGTQPAVILEPTKEIQKMVQVEKPAEPECFNASFRHKKTPGHTHNEDCSRHKNIVKLSHAGVNAQSLCVRVNGRPVAFQRLKNSEIQIGALAGPDALITVRYCLGKVKCAEDCKVPRDEFMEAIGALGEESENVGKWDSSDGHARDLASARADAEIRKEMAEMEDGVDVFKDWLSDSSVAQACAKGGTQVAAQALSKKGK